MMSRRKQSHPKSVKRDDLPGGIMKEEEGESTSQGTTNSLNGDDAKSPASTVEDEELIEEDGVSLTSSSAAAVSPTPPPPPPAGAGRPPAGQSSPPSSSSAPPSVPLEMPPSLKRRREDSSPPPAQQPPPQPPPPQHPGLPFSADLLHSLQYFALLRQSLPNGSLMNLPVIPHIPTQQQRQVSPPPANKQSGLNHTCPSCGICFSSASTLSAHATYYCSKRLQPPNAAQPPPPAPPANNEAIPTHPEAIGTPLSNGNRSLSPDQQIPDDLDRPSGPKIRRSGRYYACPYCSFSADKRVSLNRHMRVHVGLPLLATHPVSPPPPQVQLSAGMIHSDSSRSLSDPSLASGSSPEFRLSKTASDLEQQQQGKSDSSASDRYCAECKIQFSSLKTFQVHKQHYCQSRKPAAGMLPVGIPEEIERSSQADGPGGPMTILVLPTQPPIVVPLCILQSARLLTAEQPMPARSIIVSPHGDIQFRTESPVEPRPSVVPPPRPVQSPIPAAVPPPPTQTASAPPEPPTSPVANRDEQALDLSSKQSDDVEESPEPSVDPPAAAPPATTGAIRIREELAHVNQTVSPGGTGPINPALPFLPPKVFAELEALGMCLGVPSGHDMSSNPAQWLAMLENAVLQASSMATASPDKTASNLLKVRQAQRPSSAIPCEECNISFRRMESYLVHKQYYCAARHQTGKDQAGPPPPPLPPSAEVNGNNPPDLEPASAAQREPVIQRTAGGNPSTGKVPCPACGIEFESAATLQAHRTYYCSKRDGGDPAVSKKPSPESQQQQPSSTPASSGPTPPSTATSPAASGSASGGIPQLQLPTQQQGWKCPCCDTVSPTAASAQKHVETHSNVRAFRCTVCGYRGNTLRGMRTHVRIHFDRRTSGAGNAPVELYEDNYISCIMNGAGPGELFNQVQSGGGGMPGSAPDVDQIFKSLGIPPEICAKVLSAPAQHPQESASLGSVRAGRELAGSSLAGLQFLQLAQRIANHSPGPTTGAGCRSDKLFLCDLCCYSSSYRGNVIRHSKLVHGREISDVAVVSSNFLQQAVSNSKGPSSLSGSDSGRMKLSTENSPPLRHGPLGATTPVPILSGSPDEAIQVKIDPDDLLVGHHPSTGGSNNSSHSGHSPLAEYNPQPASAAVGSGAPSGGSDPFRKHCKSCNITFTYMNTFLAHKKYYCSSHAPLDPDQPDELMDEEEAALGGGHQAASPPSSSSEAHHSEATPT